MNSSDEKSQQKTTKFSAVVSEGKLLLEINDNITYKGVIQSSPYYDIYELKNIFEKGQIQILVKTTSKMNIKLSILKIQLLSQENKQLHELKKRVEELQNQLKYSGQWEQENLDLKSNFDLDYIYKISTNSGWSLISTGVSAATLNFNYSGTNYTTSSTNRRANSTGWVVTKMMRFKV